MPHHTNKILLSGLEEEITSAIELLWNAGLPAKPNYYDRRFFRDYSTDKSYMEIDFIMFDCEISYTLERPVNNELRITRMTVTELKGVQRYHWQNAQALEYLASAKLLGREFWYNLDTICFEGE